MDSKAETENCGLLADEPREGNSNTNSGIRIPLVPNSAPRPSGITYGKKWMVGFCGMLLFCGTISAVVFMTIKLIGLEGRMKKAEIENSGIEEQMKKTEIEYSGIEERMKKAEIENSGIEERMKKVENPPYFHTCGAHYNGLTISSQTIPYSDLLYHSTNLDGVGLDITTGVFYAPYTGTYSVTWSLMSQCHNGLVVNIYLRKNGKKITDSLHKSYLSSSAGIIMQETGGRTIIIHLDKGNTLDLFCENCNSIYVTTFCVSLSTPDMQ